jgi:hypothetical protein
MPRLLLEPFVWPVNLFAGSPSPGEGARWWVLHTRPRAEKALCRRLLVQNKRFFLPICKRACGNGARADFAYLPMFASYLFLFGDTQDRLHALETNLVAQVLGVEDQAQLQRDLARVHQLMVTGAPLWPEPQLPPGACVKIIAGPLMGMPGKIITRRNKSRFFVEVQFLQQGVSLDIDSRLLERLPSPMLTGSGA